MVMVILLLIISVLLIWWVKISICLFLFFNIEYYLLRFVNLLVWFDGSDSDFMFLCYFKNLLLYIKIIIVYFVIKC